MVDAAQERLRRDVGCPFCGLACDDLTIGEAAGRLRVVEAGCWLSRQGYESSAISAQARVDGRPAPLAAALERAAAILSASRAPAFVVAADVAGARSAMALADRLGGVIDHPDSAALLRNLRVMQDVGALATTLSEVRNRADVILIVGPDPSPRLPRFYERCVDVEETLFGTDPRQRELFRLGPPTEGPAPTRAAPEVTEFICGMEHLPAAISALGAAMRGARREDRAIDGIPAERIELLASRLEAARYGVVVWMPAAFDTPHGEVMGQSLLELVRQVTQSTRCSLLALGGGGNLFGVNQVCTWQSGYPVPTGFGRGIPEHDPYRFSARRMVADGEADALVWVAALGGSAPPAGSDVPTVLLAPQPPQGDRPPAVYLPVGIPGLDHAGQLFRTDNVVALRVPALRDAQAPDAAAMLDAIGAQLAKEPRP